MTKERLKTDGNTEPEMAILNNRIASFQTWPVDNQISALLLANCGLHYTGRQDLVKCHVCNVVINNWKQDDLPSQRHKRESPNCKIAIASIAQSHSNKRSTVFKERVQNETSSKSKPVLIDENNHQSDPLSVNSMINCFTSRIVGDIDSKSIDYKIESNRLASFKGNWSKGVCIQPIELAKAGFYYIGPKDRVRCAWCKNSLRNWEPGDTAFGEHFRHYGDRCSFVQSREKTCQIVRDIGYNSEIVQRAFNRLAANSSLELNVTNLLETLFNLEFDRRAENTVAENTVVENTVVENTVVENTVAGNSHKSSLISKENRQLKERNLCKICLDNEICILFIPCRHVATCEECADAIKQCPICRALIVGTLKTFLA